MGTLLDVDDIRGLVDTSADDATIDAVLDREEAELVRRFGAHYVDADTPVEETLAGGRKHIYITRPLTSVESVAEAYVLGDAAMTLAATDFYAWATEGKITRLPEGAKWGRIVTVSYVPVDDNELRRQVLIELCRVALTQTALQSESQSDNGASYSYTVAGGGSWQQTREEQYRRLGAPSL
jgi:hypothetical protein